LRELWHKRDLFAAAALAELRERWRNRDKLATMWVAATARLRAWRLKRASRVQSVYAPSAGGEESIELAGAGQRSRVPAPMSPGRSRVPAPDHAATAAAPSPAAASPPSSAPAAAATMAPASVPAVEPASAPGSSRAPPVTLPACEADPESNPSSGELPQTVARMRCTDAQRDTTQSQPSPQVRRRRAPNLKDKRRAFPPPALAAASLPAGWVVGTDPASGQTYYANVATGESQWHHPSGVEAAKPAARSPPSSPDPALDADLVAAESVQAATLAEVLQAETPAWREPPARQL